MELVQYLLQNGAISPLSTNNRRHTPDDEVPLTHPNRLAILQMFDNLSLVRMQPMDISKCQSVTSKLSMSII